MIPALLAAAALAVAAVAAVVVRTRRRARADEGTVLLACVATPLNTPCPHRVRVAADATVNEVQNDTGWYYELHPRAVANWQPAKGGVATAGVRDETPMLRAGWYCPSHDPRS